MKIDMTDFIVLLALVVIALIPPFGMWHLTEWPGKAFGKKRTPVARVAQPPSITQRYSLDQDHVLMIVEVPDSETPGISIQCLILAVPDGSPTMVCPDGLSPTLYQERQ